jgi:hypothetical protein
MGAANLDSLEYDWDAAIEIGCASHWNLVTLTRIGFSRDSKKQVVFQDEIEAEQGIFPRIYPYIRQSGEDEVGSIARWMQLAVRVRLDEVHKAKLKTDLTVVLAASNTPGWRLSASFRKPRKKGEIQFEIPRLKAARDDAEVIARIDSMEVDIWETGRYLTAAISTPKVPYFDDTRQNHYPDRVEAVVVGLTWGSRVRGNPRFWSRAPTGIGRGQMGVVRDCGT